MALCSQGRQEITLNWLDAQPTGVCTQARDAALLGIAPTQDRLVDHRQITVYEGEHRVQVHGATLLGHLHNKNAVHPVGHKLLGQVENHRPSGALGGPDQGQRRGDHQHIASLHRQGVARANGRLQMLARGQGTLVEPRRVRSHRLHQQRLPAPGPLGRRTQHQQGPHHRRQVSGEEQVGQRIHHLLIADHPSYQSQPQLGGVHRAQALHHLAAQALQLSDLGDQALAGSRISQRRQNHLVQVPDFGGRGEHRAELCVLLLGRGHIYQVVKEQVVLAAWVDVLRQHAREGQTRGLDYHAT